MQQHPDWQAETAHLQRIRTFIGDLLAQKVREVSTLTSEEADINRDMWEEVGNFRDLEGVSEFMQYIGQLKQNMAMARFNRREIERLDRLYLSPYFARIDFGAAGNEPEPCYIGITTLMDDDTARLLIHDWRAPVSSLFYDWEPGDVTFQSPGGTVRGKMTLKRQFRLEGGRLILMFDAGLAIHDEILQDLLAGATGGHMRQIVSTIQKEQNRAIRFEQTRVLAVQGAAGSGKTAIAMHRAAYLLYRHRQVIKPEDLIILSPNALLGEYIADVLPELGEDRIAGVPFLSLAADVPDLAGYHLETVSELMEAQLSHPSAARADMLAHKASPAYLSALDAFVESLSRAYPFLDLSFHGETIVSAAELSALYTQDFQSMGIGRRLARIRLRVLEQINTLDKTHTASRAAAMEEADVSVSRSEARALSRNAVRQECQRLRDELDHMTVMHPVRLYRHFAEQTLPPREAAHTCRRLDNHLIRSEDLAPLLYLALACHLLEPDTRVRHVLVDEAQDFTRLQYAVLRLFYPRTGFSLLGDANQNILTENAIGNLAEAAAVLDPDSHACLSLNRTYRCTLPISRLADCFRHDNTPIDHFGRPGPLPVLMTLTQDGTPDAALLDALEMLVAQTLANGHHTLAVLTRTQADAGALYKAWEVHPTREARLPASMVMETEARELSGLLFLPVWLAKGLEFEEVALVFEQRADYAAPREKGLLYTACTRALHRLTFLSQDGMPQVLETIPAALYETTRAVLPNARVAAPEERTNK
jgi:DNA helicase-2/ATP-dependent DNA helicase PcrA